MKISEYILLNEYRPKLSYICKYRIPKNVPNSIYKNLRRSDCECTLCNAFLLKKRMNFYFCFIHPFIMTLMSFTFGVQREINGLYNVHLKSLNIQGI